MSIYELKILFDLNPESKIKILDKCAKKFYLGYFFVDSENGQCYLFNRYGEEKDVSLIHEINEDMILDDIKKIIIPNNVTSIKGWSFFGCNELTSVTIPNSVTSIKSSAFRYCIRLTSVTIPNSVTRIWWYAFCNCSGLTNMTIPDRVTSIGEYAFYDCNNLKSLIFKGKTIDQVKSMRHYPFGIRDESIIEAELS